MAHNMFAASGSAPSAHHNLFGILIKIAFDLSAPQPQTIHHRDVFGRRLSAVLFVPEGFDERFLAHHLHGRLRPIRLFHVKNLERPLVLAEDDQLLLDELLRDNDSTLHYNKSQSEQGGPTLYEFESKPTRPIINHFLQNINNAYPALSFVINSNSLRHRKRI